MRLTEHFSGIVYASASNRPQIIKGNIGTFLSLVQGSDPFSNTKSACPTATEQRK